MGKYKEAIETIKLNYPPENYTMLRESLDLAIEVLAKQTPKIPLNQRVRKDELIGSCPTCRLSWDVGNWERYCSNCGQKLDWR